MRGQKSFLVFAAQLFLATALSTPWARAAEIKRGGHPVVVMKTSLGEIEIALDAKRAPKTTGNFLKYTEEGHYNGTIFHRVMRGFMIQGGGLEPGMKEKKTRASIPNEADNGLKNLRGTIAMARTSDPHSATAQFFINVVDNGFLDFKSKTPDGWGYAVFGKVIRGMDVVDKIRMVPTGTKGFFENVPKEDVVMESVTMKKQ